MKEPIDMLDDEVQTFTETKTKELIDMPSTYPIYFEWVAARPDPTSYKQLAPEFHPMGLQIAVDVPIRFFVTYDVDSHQGILTPEGMAYATRQINLAITKVMSREG
jgi:hypothetical protein